jgi:hypothetical protein
MDNFSLSVAQIELFGQLQDSSWVSCGVATAFFYKVHEAMKLVTNWHVVTGVDPATMQPIVRIDPATLQPIDPGPLPTTLRLFYKQHLTGDRPGVETVSHDIALYEKDSAVWTEHNTRQNVDVVALDLDMTALANFVNMPINSVDQEAKLRPYAGMDCFVLGYPEGMVGPGRTPIWKRASIATEPLYDFRNSPGFLIDTATRNGMSGSPVVARHSGYFQPDPSQAMTGTEIIGTVEKFVGIYSGRLGDDPLEVQLGMVWRSEVLDNITTSNTRGYNPCR